MFANDPEMAARWAKHTPKGKKLPVKKTSEEPEETSTVPKLTEVFVIRESKFPEELIDTTVFDVADLGDKAGELAGSNPELAAKLGGGETDDYKRDMEHPGHVEQRLDPVSAIVDALKARGFVEKNSVLYNKNHYRPGPSGIEPITPAAKKAKPQEDATLQKLFADGGEALFTQLLDGR